MMKFSKKLVISLTAILVAACAPRDTTHYLSINDALNSPKAKEILNPKIKLYFGQSVSNIVSFYKRKTYSSTTQYECHAGHSISGVALKGDLVK